MKAVAFVVMGLFTAGPVVAEVGFEPGPSMDMDFDTWTWTGEQFVALEHATHAAEARFLVMDPSSGAVTVWNRSMPTDTDDSKGQLVHFQGQTYWVGLGRTVCPSDYCLRQDKGDIYVVDPVADKLERISIGQDVPLLGKHAVAGPDGIYFFGSPFRGDSRVAKLDPATGQVVLGPELPLEASRVHATWTGQRFILQVDGEWDEGFPNFVAYDPVVQRFGPLASHDFEIAVAPAAFLAGELWIVAARVSGDVDSAVVRVDPADFRLTRDASMPHGSVAVGLQRIDDRLLLLRPPGCMDDRGPLWLVPDAAPKTSAPPMAALDISWDWRETRFMVWPDACASIDDVAIVDFRFEVYDEKGLAADRFSLLDGAYLARATVTDDDGQSDTAEIVFRVDSRPPEVDWAWTADGMTIHVNASASSDPSEDLGFYGWSWSDEGPWNTSRLPDGTTGPHPVQTSFTYASPGTYNVTLTVVAEDGQRASLSRAITVPFDDSTDAGETAPWPSPILAFCLLLLRRVKSLRPKRTAPA